MLRGPAAGGQFEENEGPERQILSHLLSHPRSCSKGIYCKKIKNNNKNFHSKVFTKIRRYLMWSISPVTGPQGGPGKPVQAAA